MQSVTILPAGTRPGSRNFQGITLERGELCTIVGNTGSGKSRFIKDVEQLAHGDSVTRRRCSWTAWRSRRNAASPCLPTGGPLGAEYCASCLDARWKSSWPSMPSAGGRRPRRWRCWPWPMRSPRSLLPWAEPEPAQRRQSRALMIATSPCSATAPLSSSTRLRTPASTKSGRWACFSVMTSWCWWSPMTRTPP